MSAANGKRLRPGELDEFVLAYMREHKGDGPLTAATIAKGIEGSAVAVANCLARLAKTKEMRQAKRKPRYAVLTGTLIGDQERAGDQAATPSPS